MIPPNSQVKDYGSHMLSITGHPMSVYVCPTLCRKNDTLKPQPKNYHISTTFMNIGLRVSIPYILYRYVHYLSPFPDFT